MDVRMNSIKLESVTAEVVSAAVAEGVIDIPESVPKVSRILWSTAKIVDMDTICKEAKLEVKATVDFTVVCMGEDGMIYSVEARTDFGHDMNFPASKDGMRADVKGLCQPVECRITSDGKVGVKTVVELTGDLFERGALETATIDYGSDVECRTNSISWTTQSVHAKGVNTLRQDVRIPDGMPEIESVLTKDAHFMVDEVKTERGEAIVNGRLALNVLYSCEGGVKQAKFTVAGEVAVNDEGITPGAAAFALAEVRDLEIKTYEDEMQRRSILAIETPVAVTLVQEVPGKDEVLEDAFGIYAPVTLTTHAVELYQPMVVLEPSSREFQGKVALEGQFSGEAEACMGEATVETVTASDDMITVSGRVHAVLWSADGNECATGHVPFSCEVPAKDLKAADAMVRCNATLTSVLSYQDAEGDVHMQGNVSIKGYYKNMETVRLVSGIEEGELYVDDNKPLMLAIAQEGDTPWDLAKRCRVSMEDLIALNPGIEEGIKSGQAVVACRK